MKYEVMQSHVTGGEWLVAAIADPPEKDSDIYLAIFVGPEAEQRARCYAEWRAGLEGNLCRYGIDAGLRPLAEV